MFQPLGDHEDHKEYSFSFQFQTNSNGSILFEGNSAANQLKSNQIDVVAKSMMICPFMPFGEQEVAMRVEFKVCPQLCEDGMCLSLLYYLYFRR